MTEVVSPLNGRRLDARFTLLEKLGSGGQGEVWRAHDDTRGIDIALKVPASANAPNQSVLAAFEREHAIAASLEHSSVLKVFPPHRSGDVVVLPMELATGGDLRRLRGAVYLDIIPVLLDIAQALEHAHERGVIHRDLKPGNVLFDARGRVKLADFGAAGTTSTTAADARMQGLSPFTASPEQLRGEAPAVSDDIYGLGALAYELLSGYPPYYPHFDLRRAQEEPVPQLVPTRQIPPLLTALVMRMLAKDKRERPRSMREVIDELDVALNDTLAFDFESIVDPTHGAPTAAVLVGPAPVPLPRRPTPVPRAAPAGADHSAVKGAQGQTASGSSLTQAPVQTPPSVAAAVASTLGSARASSPGAGAAAPTQALVQTSSAAVWPQQTVAQTPAQTSSSAGAAPADASLQAASAQIPPRKSSSPAAATRPAAASAAATPSTSSAKASGPGSKARFVESYDGDEDDDDGEDKPDDDVSDAPDVGVIPELLVAHSLVVTPSEKNDRWPSVKPPTPASAAPSSSTSASARSSASTPTPSHAPKPTAEAAAAFEAAVAQSRKAHAQTTQQAAPAGTTALNDTIYLSPSSGSDAADAFEAAVAQSRKSHAQTVQNAKPVQNDTMHLPPELSPAPRGVGATWRATNAQSVNNDTMQLPPESASVARGAAVLRAAGAPSVQNDTMLLSPEASSPARGTAAESRVGYGQAANEQSIRPQLAPTRTTTSAAATGSTGSAAIPTAASSAPGPAAAPTSASAAKGSAGAAATSAAGASTQRQTFHAQSVPPAAAASSTTAEKLTPASAGSEGVAAAAGPRVIEAPIYTNERPLWETLQLDTVPRVSRLEPIRQRRWPVVLLGLLAGVAVAVFWWLPRYTTQSLPFDLSAITRATKDLAPSLTSGSTSPADAATSAEGPAAANTAEAKFQTERQAFDRRLATLETRGAGVWGGPEFGLAKSRAAESVGAHDAGNTVMAAERLTDASHLLDAVEGKAAQALTAQLAAGQKALAAGQQELADQAFDLAKRIDPNDKRIADGQRRTRNLNGVLPLLADGQNAENAQDFSRAAQDYSKVLSLDPGNDKARAGLVRSNTALGDDNYAKAVGSGDAALGAGRLDDARAAFEKARSLRPNGSEAAEGLRRVNSGSSAKGFTLLRQRAAGLEAQERWDEAVQAYDTALQADPSLAFAQEGKDRAAARAELSASMQALIDRPERLSSLSLQKQAAALLDTANQQSPSGPVLRSQIARLGMLIPGYDGVAQTGAGRTDLLDKPVRLSLVSDNATAVAIPSIGQFGTFAKREIQLKPGRYTVIGTRDGFRDIRRDIIIAPGQEGQTISVSCSDPI